MNLEIERKWLASEDIKQFIPRGGFTTIKQGYFSPNIRVRVKDTGKTTKANICIKNRETELTVKEYTYPIPVDEGLELLDNLNLIEKRRYDLGDGYTLDVFLGPLDGLLLIEKEFKTEKAAAKEELPADWEAVEVTGDTRFLNANLGDKKFSIEFGFLPRLDARNLVALVGDEEELF